MSEAVPSVQPALAGKLAGSIAQIIGPENVLTGEAVEEFRWDALGPWRGYADFDKISPQPLLVARPQTADAVSAIVRLAADSPVAVVAYGGGSGLMGGAVALRPSIVVDLKRMDSRHRHRSRQPDRSRRGGSHSGDA